MKHIVTILNLILVKKNCQIQNIDCDFLKLSVKKYPSRSDFSNLEGKHELFSKKNKNVIGKFKIETPSNFC